MKKELTKELVSSFLRYLTESKRSKSTIDKYLRDVRAFFSVTEGL